MTPAPRVWVLQLATTPASLNAVGSRGEVRAWHRAKTFLQTDLGKLLMVEQVPRGLRAVHARAELRFPLRRGRDEGNYRSILEKALGDALVAGGWLPDDTPDRYRFGELVFAPEVGEHQTLIELTEPAGDDLEGAIAA